MVIIRTLSILIFAVFLAVFAVGILMVPHNHEVGCPFMPGEQAICSMGLLEHISSWKNIFTVLIPSVLLLLGLACLLILSFKKFYLPNLLLVLQKFKPDDLSYIPNLYQQLFSQGILNPKAP